MFISVWKVAHLFANSQMLAVAQDSPWLPSAPDFPGSAYGAGRRGESPSHALSLTQGVPGTLGKTITSKKYAMLPLIVKC